MICRRRRPGLWEAAGFRRPPRLARLPDAQQLDLLGLLAVAAMNLVSVATVIDAEWLCSLLPEELAALEVAMERSLHRRNVRAAMDSVAAEYLAEGAGRD